MKYANAARYPMICTVAIAATSLIYAHAEAAAPQQLRNKSITIV